MARKTYTDQFKRDAVKLMTEQGYGPAKASVARRFDIGVRTVRRFEDHAHRRRMTPSYEMDLKMLDQHLEQVVPKDADPALFDKHSHLMHRELKAYRERARPRPARPNVPAYLELK